MAPRPGRACLRATITCGHQPNGRARWDTLGVALSVSATWRDRAACAWVGLTALGVYLRTLYPGLVGDGDTPKFQYVGAILGTPHNPGYPLYLLVSHAFSRLPFGTLAWRINLLSALAAALAVALLYVVQRRLDVSRPSAAAAALAAGFAPVFWSQATLAEVYALAAALLMAVVAATLAWGRGAPPRSTARLLVAIGLASLALGHHLTIVFVAPALLVYALGTDARAALRPRVLLGGALLVLLGLSQYLLILVRTRQGAAYLGSYAANLRELLDVMRGAQFAGRLGAFDVRTVVAERVPELARLFRAELGWAGCALAAIGLLVLARRRGREAWLLGLAAAGVVGFALNYKVDDPQVFLIPAFVLVWPFAGAGLDALVAPLARRGGRVLVAAAVLLPLLLPLGQLRAHWRASDHSGRSFETRYFRAVFEALPADSVVLAESYTIDQMALYEILGEGYGTRKGVRLSARDPDSVRIYSERGRPVFAFSRAHAELLPLGFRFTPVTLVDPAEGRPFGRRAFPLFRLSGLPECLLLGDGAWRDVSAPARDGVLLARLDNYEPFEARLLLRVWAAGAPRVARLAGKGRPALDVQPGEPAQVQVRVDDQGDFAALRLEWERAPHRLEARAVVDRPEAQRARLCRLTPGDE